MSEVSIFRLYALRAMYVFMFVGLALVKSPAILNPPPALSKFGQRGRERSRRNLAPGAAGNPLSSEDAAGAVL